MEDKHYTYLLLCENNKLYCGYTNDPDRRFQAHLSGKASKFTRANKPIKMVYLREFDTKSEALREECRIKKLSKAQKEELIKSIKNIFK
jgi:putative endonuclease